MAFFIPKRNKMRTLLKYIGILICFQLTAPFASAQSIMELKSKFQHSYGQWKLSDSIRTYNSENLYDYIDGAADAYLSNNFEGLLVTTYNGNDEKYITVEIYQQQSPIDAFGIYAQERPLHGKFVKIGAQGYTDVGLLNFLCNKYYVKISSHDESPETAGIMYKIAVELASKLDSNAQMPEILKYLPEEKKIENSESYINTNFLGYEFLRFVITANYKKDGNTFKVFIIPAVSSEKAKSVVGQYLKVVGQPFNNLEGRFTINDPHNGKISIEWKGKYIWGTIDCPESQTCSKYLKLVNDKLIGAN